MDADAPKPSIGGPPARTPPALPDTGELSVSIAVEHFLPMPGSRETDGVIEPSLLRQRADDDHVITRIEPAMKCNHSVIISPYKWMNVLSAQGWMIPAELDEVLRELEELRR